MPNNLIKTAIIRKMILVVGGSQSVRNAFITHLNKIDSPYRLLLQPTKYGVYLPKNKDVDVAIASYNDERGIRAAMKDIRAVYHLSGFEESNRHGNLSEMDVDGLKVITRAAKLAEVDRFFYLSSLGADRASGFYFLKAKGLAEAVIRDSGLDFTVIRTSQIFGPGDLISNTFSELLRRFSILAPIPADLSLVLQPLWVGDLTAALTWGLDMPETKNKLLEIGGPEQITLEKMLSILSGILRVRPKFAAYNPHTNALITVFLEGVIKDFPSLVYWTDFFAPSRTCPMDSLPRQFGINPARFHQNLEYLNRIKK